MSVQINFKHEYLLIVTSMMALKLFLSNYTYHNMNSLLQNVYMATEDVEEPEFQYVPDTPHISPLVPGTQALSQSMLLLEESLESGAITGQFEQLHRKNPSLAMDVCHTSDNQNKNRYRDISPYDNTRVILTQCPSGDYINANHVVMTIPGSGIINRYVQFCFHLLKIFTTFLAIANIS